MRTILITTTARFYHPVDCEYSLLSDSQTFSYKQWQKYLSEFDDVVIVARSRQITHNDIRFVYEATGRYVHAIPLPYFEGPWQFVLKYLSIRKELKKILNDFPHASLIVRLPCPIGMMMLRLARDRRPYAVEAVGDPWDVFSPKGVKHILRPFFRIFFRARMRRACKNAIATSYVTERYLQERYPCNGLSFGVSDIELKECEYILESREYRERNRSFSLICVGTLEQLYKAPDILIKAVSICVEKGYPVRLSLIGDGRRRSYLEELAKELDIEDRVEFMGTVSREEVFRRLDEADLFILPSITEGLPRAMLEAMARGLPCIGSTAGGIPELLHEDDMVPPGEAEKLADKIIETISDPERMTAMSERNLKKARKYCDEILKERRESFYRYVREKTEEIVCNRQT